jgi:peroxin-6
MLTYIDRFTLHPSLSLTRVSTRLPFTYTGADMYALCSDAMLKAITRSARAVDDKVKNYNQTHHPKTITIAYFFDHLATEEDTAVLVTERDFMDAHGELVPSVSADELRHYDGVRRQFEGVGKKVDGGKKEGGKGKAIDGAEQMVLRTENATLNGSAAGKGKGQALVNHGGKSSVDIAEGGFGDATLDDDLYS